MTKWFLPHRKEEEKRRTRKEEEKELKETKEYDTKKLNSWIVTSNEFLIYEANPCVKCVIDVLKIALAAHKHVREDLQRCTSRCYHRSSVLLPCNVVG